MYIIPFVKIKFKIDDPVGTTAVHLVNRLWGMIALRLFTDVIYCSGLNVITGGVT